MYCNLQLGAVTGILFYSSTPMQTRLCKLFIVKLVPQTINMEEKLMKLRRGREERHFQSFCVQCLLSSHQNQPTTLDGGLSVELDSVKYLDSVYKQTSRSSGGRDEEFTKIEAGNPFWPLGLTRTYTYDYSGGNGGLNFPTTVRAYSIVPSFMPRPMPTICTVCQSHFGIF